MEIPYVVTPRKDTGLFNSKIAIWLFLASEVMLFGGLFSGYVFLRLGADYPWPERTLPVLPGLLNTFILIASSVTVVFAWASLKMRKWVQFQIFMAMTVLCALVFMAFKGLEYSVKFHHQAARLADYTVVEGHIDYEKPAGADHGGHDEHAEPVTDAMGEKVEMNVQRFHPETLTFDLLRVYKPWVESFVAEAEQAEATITLANELNFNRPDAETPDPAKVFAAGEKLSVELLEKLFAAQKENRAFNQSKRTAYLREAWDLKWQEVKENDLLGQAAFVAGFPAGSELPSAEREKAYARWKAGMRANFATGVSAETVTLGNGETVPVVIDGRKLSEIERPETQAATFNVASGAEPFTLRFKNHDVITDYREGLTSITLRDGTTLAGKQGNSSMDFHYVDGIDFQHLVMNAEEKGIDPLIAIENSWMIKNNPEVAELWEKHQKAVEQLAQALAEKDREPTHKDRYRMGWQEIAYYMDTPLEDVQIEEGAFTPPRVTMTLLEHFKGPDYDHRHFPHISIPRAEVAMDSKFTPKWNTYYAIYFTITGLHGLHVVGGAIVLAYYLFFGRKMYLSNPEWLANRVEVGGLFWHFVDLVWIFAFPIFYLM